MQLFELITILMALTAGFAYLNHRFLKLPDTIGMLLISLLFSVSLIFLDFINPSWLIFAKEAAAAINFTTVLMDVMLCFLLFAGSFHTDFEQLYAQRRPVVTFALAGVIFSTFLIATLLYYLLGLLNIYLDYVSCLLFGALISPTDPVAVLGILAKLDMPERLKITIVGESLFNDGVGVVVFATILQIIRLGSEQISVGDISLLFFREAGGGLLFGLALGYVTFYLLRSIDHYETEVMITIAVVMVGNVLAHYLHVSGPLAMVVVGLFTGSHVRGKAMSDLTEEYVDKFWEIVDVVLNGILFVLIGLMILSISLTVNEPIALSLSISTALAVVLIARYLTIRLPLLLLDKWLNFDRKASLVLTWGGLRGGLSIAMALSIPDTVAAKNFIVVITYSVVLFSIVVQGLTLERLVKRLY